MQEILVRKLHEFLASNHPELLLSLQQEGKVSDYLVEKVADVNDLLERLRLANTPTYLIEEQCLESLKQDFGPSPRNYLRSVLEEEFATEYNRLTDSGILTYELVNLLEVCAPVFERFGFSFGKEEDRFLRYAITGAVSEYLESKQ